MIQEDKELLFKDISARFPYGIKCFTKYGALPISQIYDDCSVMFKVKSPNGNGIIQFGCDIPQPYLRPMSSMTNKERSDYEHYCRMLGANPYGGFNEVLVNYLNSHYIDFRGLIPSGLAIIAPEGMYKF